MPESSHDSSYPHPGGGDARHRDITLRSPRTGRSNRRRPRARISFHDADRVALRLAGAGRDARVRGVAGEVLAAVIELLPTRWTRIRDDQLRLRQVVALCPSNPHQRSVGRALAALQQLEIIVYRPARGRGATATIEVHPRLLDGISELDRDDDGRVVVPFSRPSTSSSTEENPLIPQEPTGSGQVGGRRPVEVDVDPAEIRQVLSGMPAVYRQLPHHLRWLLGKAVRGKLSRGWRPDQILEVLAADLPAAGVARPFRLAMWRLAANQPGAGPRLTVLQRRWDRHHDAAQREAHNARTARAYQRVRAVTSPGQRAAMITAITALFGVPPDSQAAVITAARRAARQYPHLPEAEAITAWLRDGDTRTTPGPSRAETAAPEPIPPDWRTSGGGCVSCGQPGRIRHELPLQSIVCDTCLTAAA